MRDESAEGRRCAVLQSVGGEKQWQPVCQRVVAERARGADYCSVGRRCCRLPLLAHDADNAAAAADEVAAVQCGSTADRVWYTARGVSKAALTALCRSDRSVGCYYTVQHCAVLSWSGSAAGAAVGGASAVLPPLLCGAAAAAVCAFGTTLSSRFGRLLLLPLVLCGCCHRTMLLLDRVLCVSFIALLPCRSPPLSLSVSHCHNPLCTCTQQSYGVLLRDERRACVQHWPLLLLLYCCTGGWLALRGGF